MWFFRAISGVFPLTMLCAEIIYLMFSVSYLMLVRVCIL